MENLPVAIIGGGPVGLAAAAHLISRGVPAKLYESAETVGGNVREWGHVRLFSPWRYNTDPASRDILKRHGWQEPPGDVLPTGNDLFDAYLKPLSQTPELSALIETKAKVRSVARRGSGKTLSRGRGRNPFSLVVENGATRIDLARAVIDASGTWQNQNPLGASGVDAAGEDAFAGRIAYGIPDVLGAARDTYRAQRVLVVGSGHSAANVLLDLARLAESDGKIEITWSVRTDSPERAFGGGSADQLEARGKLGTDLRNLVESGRVRFVTGFAAERLDADGDGIRVSGLAGGREVALPAVDRIVVATGQRPDLDLTREIRLDLDPALESTRALGPLIDPNVHSCGSVPPHGYKELAHPEPDYFVAGVKSYGRAPTFLLATGYEQVRSIAAHIAGDEKAASEVHLVLPETGVCTTGPSGQAGECCGGPAPAQVDACCADDATAKSQGAKGCGCHG